MSPSASCLTTITCTSCSANRSVSATTGVRAPASRSRSGRAALLGRQVREERPASTSPTATNDSGVPRKAPVTSRPSATRRSAKTSRAGLADDAQRDER